MRSVWYAPFGLVVSYNGSSHRLLADCVMAANSGYIFVFCVFSCLDLLKLLTTHLSAICWLCPLSGGGGHLDFDNVLSIIQDFDSADDVCSSLTAAKSLLRRRLCTHELPPAIFGYESERRFVYTVTFCFLVLRVVQWHSVIKKVMLLGDYTDVIILIYINIIWQTRYVLAVHIFFITTFVFMSGECKDFAGLIIILLS